MTNFLHPEDFARKDGRIFLSVFILSYNKEYSVIIELPIPLGVQQHRYLGVQQHRYHIW